jgi:hypothetical protein
MWDSNGYHTEETEYRPKGNIKETGTAPEDGDREETEYRPKGNIKETDTTPEDGDREEMKYRPKGNIQKLIIALKDKRRANL